MRGIKHGTARATGTVGRALLIGVLVAVGLGVTAGPAGAVAPSVTINQKSAAPAQADPTSSWPINFTVVFSAPVTGFTGADVTISGSALGTKTKVVTPAAGPATTYNVEVSGMNTTGTVVATIAADVVTEGNTASTSTDNSVQYNVPTVTLNQAVGQPDPTNETTIDFTAVFSVPVTGFTGADVNVSGGAPGPFTAVVTPAAGPATTYNVAVSGMTGPGSVGVFIPTGKVDGGNAFSTSTDSGVFYDNVGPTVTIDQRTAGNGQADPTTASTINFTAVFDQNVSGFTSDDVTITGTAPPVTPGAKTVVVTGSSFVYNVAVSGMTGPGTVIATVKAGAVVDALGNPSPASTSTDNSVQFNGAAVTVFRPSTAQFFVRGGSPELTQYGIVGDIPVPADYNGDGALDTAVYRPSTGQWFIRNAAPVPEVTPYGAACVSNCANVGDVPVPADYDGDGRDDIAIYRPSTGQWFVKDGNPEVTQYGAPCGACVSPTDIPVPADYTGDGRANKAIWRMTTGQWFVRGGLEAVPYGVVGDIPVPADYDGDGDAEFAVYRPSTGQWLRRGITPEIIQYGLGGACCGDVPVAADYTADGLAEVAIYRRSTGQWFVRGGSPEVVPYGVANDIPLELPYAIRVRAGLTQ